MNSRHLVPLRALDTVFDPNWGLSCISSVYDHVLYGPERLLVRSASLTTLRDARHAILASMPRAVRDANKGG